MAVTPTPSTYQCAEIARITCGRGKEVPSVRQALVKRLRSSAFVGLPCPTKSAGILGERSIGSKPALPHLAAFALRPHHRRVRLAREGSRERGQVRERTDDAILADRMRVALNHGARELRTHGVATELAPGDEELLLLGEPVDRRLRRLAAL